MLRFSLRIALLFLLFIIIGLPGYLSKNSTQKQVSALATEVFQAFKVLNYQKIEKFIHPEKGIRFSPYAYVDIKNDQIFKQLSKDKKKYLWGSYDGSGESIELTFQEYLDGFVLDKDYQAAPQKSFNEVLGQGNTIQNHKEVYPDSVFVEYHFPAFEDSLDWRSLRLFFEKYENKWFLVAVVHDGWTI